MVDVHKNTGTSVNDIMKWNDIKNTRQLHPGTRIIIAKGNPNEPTKAEKLAVERERRLAGGHSTASNKSSRLLSVEDISLIKPSRLQLMMKGDNDEDSLANRLFGRAKVDVELFPTSTVATEGVNSLSARLNHPKEHRSGILHASISPHISAENEEEWGDASDSLMLAMIDIYVEREIFYMAKELLNRSSSHESIGGRIRDFGRRQGSLTNNLLPKIEESQEDVCTS